MVSWSEWNWLERKGNGENMKAAYIHFKYPSPSLVCALWWQFILRIACKTTRHCKSVEPAGTTKSKSNLDSDGATMHAPFAAFKVVPRWRGETPADTACFRNGRLFFLYSFPGILPPPAKPATAAVTLLVPWCSGLRGQWSRGLCDCLAASQLHEQFFFI